MKKTYFIILVILIANCAKPNTKDFSERNARRFLQNSGINARAVECMDYDQDSDGYVSCTIFQQEVGRPPVSIECGALLPPDAGCNSVQVTSCRMQRNAINNAPSQ